MTIDFDVTYTHGRVTSEDGAWWVHRDGEKLGPLDNQAQAIRLAGSVKGSEKYNSALPSVFEDSTEEQEDE